MKFANPLLLIHAYKSQLRVPMNTHCGLLPVSAMKTIYLIAIGAIILVAGCAKSRDALQAAGITIVSATYGSGTSFADVTSRVKDSLRQPNAECFANPKSLETDPSPGWNKTLVIVYEFKWQRHLLAVGEGGKVNVAALLEEARK
jgi:hypothetical protein